MQVVLYHHFDCHIRDQPIHVGSIVNVTLRGDPNHFHFFLSDIAFICISKSSCNDAYQAHMDKYVLIPMANGLDVLIARVILFVNEDGDVTFATIKDRGYVIYELGARFEHEPHCHLSLVATSEVNRELAYAKLIN